MPKDHCTHMQFLIKQKEKKRKKKKTISGLLVLKQPNTINGKDPPIYYYTVRGEKKHASV